MQYYRTDVPQTAAEVFDGELVIANYQSGLYYSVTAAGAVVWQGLRHGYSDEEVLNWLATRYSGEAGLEQRVGAFIARMVEEGLLVPSSEPESGTALPELADTLGAMEVEKFEYLQELLLLDPVHDVVQAGWPHKLNDTD